MAAKRIMTDPAIMFGKPVVKGTRITVEHILRKLATGKTALDIVADHPNLTVEDVHAAAEYAADYLAHEEVVYSRPDVQ